MSQSLQIPNFKDTNITERSTLQLAASAGTGTIVLENPQGFDNSLIAYLGSLGSETGEAVTLGLTTGGSTATSTLKFDHAVNTRAYVLLATQANVYRAVNSTGLVPELASFSLLSTVDLDLDQDATFFTDQAGSSDYWYLFTYYDPTTQAETDKIPANAVRGGSANTYCGVEAIRAAAGFENARYVTDIMIAPHRSTAQSRIDGVLNGKYKVPFSAPINPQIIAITVQLAAGYLLLDQYPNSPDRGNAKVKWAETELDKITKGEVVLLDSAGITQQLAINADGSGYPNESTQFEYGEDRLFRIADVSNDYGRKY